MSAIWSVPIEAVRGNADFAGVQTLLELAAQYARYQSTATVELGPDGFVATLIYRLPGHPDRIHHAHLGLVWAPTENRYRPPVPVKPGEGPFLEATEDHFRFHQEQGQG